MHGIVLAALLAQPGSCGPSGCGPARPAPAAPVFSEAGPVRRVLCQRPMILRRVLFHRRGR